MLLDRRDCAGLPEAVRINSNSHFHNGAGIVPKNPSAKLPPAKHAGNRTRYSDGPVMERRPLLLASSMAGLLIATRYSNSAETTQSGVEPVLQPVEASASAFMERAFEMRRRAVDLGDQAYGAVLVKDGVIIGQSWSRVVIDEDPTGHAEMAAIRDTARRLGSRDLSGAVMYSSSRPCPMCEAAAYWAGIGQLVHGRNGDSTGAPKLCR